MLTHHIQVYPISLPLIGYDAMGYEMSKPHLRSELEADLKRYEENLFVLLALIADTCTLYTYVYCTTFSVNSYQLQKDYTDVFFFEWVNIAGIK